MTDTLVQRVENQPFETGKLGVPFVEVVNAVGKHFNHTSADDVSTRFKRDPNSGDTVIGIQSRATAREVLVMLKGETNTDISDFGRRLKDIGILLSREEVVQRSNKAKEFAKSVYAVGCSIRNEETSDSLDLANEQISNESQEYKDELFLWAIGRDNPDSSFARNLHRGKRLHPVEIDLYGDKIVKTQRGTIEKRSRETLSRRDRIIRFFVTSLERSGGELPEQTKQGLEKTYLSAARQAVIHILTKNAWTNWEKNLRIPPKERHKYLDDHILQIFEKIPGFSNESLRIVDAVEELSKSERWKELSQIERVRDIWDICQTYAHAETFKPTKAIDTRELECQLKTFLAGNLLKIFVPEVKTGVWYEDSHTKLALQLEGKNYLFDASAASKMGNFTRNMAVTDNDNYYGKMGIGITKEINDSLNRFFETGIDNYIQDEKNGYEAVGDFNKNIVSGILGNFARDLKNGLAIEIYQMLIDISPNMPGLYIILGNRLPDEEAIRMYRKAIEIHPNSEVAYTQLGIRLKGEEAIKMFKKAIKINPTYSRAYEMWGNKLTGEEAIEKYRLALKYDPKNVDVAYKIAYAIFSDTSLQTQAYIQEALVNLNKYITLTKSNPLNNTSPHFTIFIPKMKMSLEQKLVMLKSERVPLLTKLINLLKN